MSKFNLFSYAEQLVENLKPIKDKTMLRAFGVEDLIDFQSKMSRIKERCLIAVNGYDQDLTQVDSDSKAMLPQYAIIVVQPCTDTKSNTIFEAAEQCSAVTEEIYKKMAMDEKNRNSPLYAKRILNVKFAGIGPIGDNFYGSALYFLVKETYNYKPNPELWQQSEE